MSMVKEISLVPNDGGLSETISVSTTSAQSTVLSTEGDMYVNVYSTHQCFMRMGLDPIALGDGTDQLIPADKLLRVGPIPANYKLAFVMHSGSSTVYLTKEA